MIKNQIFVILFTVMFSVKKINAQSLLYKIPLEDQIEQASLIVEGKVVERKSYLSSINNHIYTINKIQIYRVFKGVQEEFINVVTKGGSIDFKKEEVMPSLQLRKNTMGVFILEPEINQFEGLNTPLNTYHVYSDLQGFYAYNEYENTVSSPYYSFSSIQESFYSRLSSITNKNTELLEYNFAYEIASKNLASNTISSFTPLEVHSGTDETIVISGTDFGNEIGSVQFKNADNGGFTYESAFDSGIRDWSNTSITVLVPSFAGTGNIRVITSDGEVMDSISELTVTSSELNAEFTGLPEETFRSKLINADGQNGYTWTYNESFFIDSDAVAAFERAIDEWRCATNISWLISEEQSVINQATDDGINLIMFQSGTRTTSDDIEPGILAVTSTYYLGCVNGDTVTSYVAEVDMTFNSDFDWYFEEDGEPGAFENDFQGTATHELGHAHNLGHVIAPTNLMHFNTSSGPDSATRIIDANSIEGALINFDFSKTSGQCEDVNTIEDRDCEDDSVKETNTQEDFIVIVNPVGDQLDISIRETNGLEYSFLLYDMSGRTLIDQTLVNLNELLDVSFLNNGVYIVKIVAGADIEVKKILKL